MVKTSILISSIFSMGALANPLLEQLGRKFSMLGTMLFTQTNTTLTSGDISKRIQQYGCYCFRDATNSGVLFGNGEPVSPQDELCRNLMRCRKCLEMEFPGECDVSQEKYVYSIDETTNEIVCSTEQAPCRYEKCECDKHFAVELGKIWSDETFEAQFWLNAKNVARRNKRNEDVFDAEATCVKKNENAVNKADLCCGAVGQKQPFSLDRQDCCDGQLVSIGQCPL